MNYTPLYVKTHNSLLSSTITIEGLINYAINNNIKSLSVCDNTMYGVMDFYHLCKKNNIKPIIGLEVTLDNKKIVLYCKDNVGYTNLIYLCTKQSEGKIDLNVLKDHSTNIICILPFNLLNNLIPYSLSLSMISPSIYTSSSISTTLFQFLIISSSWS